MDILEKDKDQQLWFCIAKKRSITIDLMDIIFLVYDSVPSISYTKWNVHFLKYAVNQDSHEEIGRANEMAQ